MCGRYVTPDERELESCFQLRRHHWQCWIARYNVGPTTPVPLVYMPQAEVLGDIARWGLIPSWWKKEAPPTVTFNARSEEAAAKPMWRHGIRSARCLMPAKGWYEWNENESVLTGSGARGHQPYYFHCPDAEVLAIAGLWSRWRAPDGSEVLSCALLTKEASAAGIAAIHQRMPVVLDPSHFEEWLSPRSSARDVEAMIAGSRADFVAHRVSTRVNSVRNDSPELIEELPAP